MTLEVSALEKRFGDIEAVRRISFHLGPGQVLSLLGPSGCGKTTTLRMIAGFERPTSGAITLGGRDITHMPARRRNIGMVFQSYALFPHLTAAENVAFGLEMRNTPRAERDSRVRRALDVVRMPGLDDRLPKHLSGGQQQRIALARALVIEPDLLLLDEPLSALDLKLREEMRDEIYRIVRELNIMTVFVTHDQGEALVLSDVIAVMNKGAIEQMDSPKRLYREPATAFVARFLGGANVLKGRPHKTKSAIFTTEAGVDLPLHKSPSGNIQAVSIRPEDIKLTAADGSDAGARVVRSRFLGGVVEYTIELPGGHLLTARGDSRRLHAEGAPVALSFDPESFVFLPE
jgi:putative spermidine/putrescine transport system ATP-binding protein